MPSPSRSSKTSNENITTAAAEAAQATLAAFQSQQRAAALHAKAVAAEAAKRNAKRAGELRAFYETALADAFRARDCERIATLLDEARADVASVEVTLQDKTRATGKVALKPTIDDRTAIVSVYRAICSAFGVEDSGLSAWDYRAETYKGRSVIHPVVRRFTNAFESNTPAAWSVALETCEAYLKFWVVAGGRQQHLRSTTPEGYEMLPRYRAWVAEACASLDDERRAATAPAAH